MMKTAMLSAMLEQMARFMILMEIFQKSEVEATQLMLFVHEQGEAVAGTYILDIALSKVDKATSLARQNGFPLKLTTKPHQQ